MRTNIMIEDLIQIFNNADISNKKEISDKDKKALLNYIEKECFNLADIKYLVSSLNFDKSDVLNMLYQLLAILHKTNKSEFESTFIRSNELIKKASALSFTWPNSPSCLKKVEEEFMELKTAVKEKDCNNIKEEFGDLLFTLLCFADLENLNILNILRSANEKFEKRFNLLKEIASSKNIDLNSASLEIKEQLWFKAKEKSDLPQ